MRPECELSLPILECLKSYLVDCKPQDTGQLNSCPTVQLMLPNCSQKQRSSHKLIHPVGCTKIEGALGSTAYNNTCPETGCICPQQEIISRGNTYAHIMPITRDDRRLLGWGFRVLLPRTGVAAATDRLSNSSSRVLQA